MNSQKLTGVNPNHLLKWSRRSELIHPDVLSKQLPGASEQSALAKIGIANYWLVEDVELGLNQQATWRQRPLVEHPVLFIATGQTAMI